MKNSIIIFLSLLLASSACQKAENSEQTNQTPVALTNNVSPAKQYNITIKGEILNPSSEGEVVLYKLANGGRENFATFEVKGGKFSKSISLDEPNFFIISFYDKQESILVLADSDVSIKADGADAEGIFEVTGSPDTDLFNEYQSVQEELNQEMGQFQSAFYAAKTEEEAKKAEQEYNAFIDKAKGKIKGLITKMNGSVVSILAASMLDPNEEFDYLENLGNTLLKKYPTSNMVKDFQKEIVAVKATAVGQPAPDISLPRPNGETLTLSSLRGKYVLIDFWASWCGPCRQENPNVVKVYNKYKDKGFEIFGVSLDKDKEKWLKAIEKDGLTWEHVSDLQFWQSQVVPLYRIEGIPMTVLVDPEGKIVAKNLRGAALEEKLAEVL